MSVFDRFTGLYQVSKTLRFELKPIGKTLEHIEETGLIAQDEQRAREYKEMKGIIDRYHKRFISMCLYGFKLKLKSDGKKDSLEEYFELISKANRTEEEKRRFDKVKGNLRKQIVGAFKKGGTYGDLFKKELIQKHLTEIAETDEERVMIDNFQKFTTYFKGFHENRRNMYSDEEKSTSIAYRLVNENLPLFYDNMRSFVKIEESEVSCHFAEIETGLDIEHIDEMFRPGYFSEVLTQEQIEVYNDVLGGRVEGDLKIKGINEYVNLYNQQQKEKRNRLPLLKPLYKMILSDREAVSWLPEEFDSDEKMLAAINEAIETLQSLWGDNKDKSLKYLLQHIGDYDLSRIYIANDLGLTDISQQMFGRYDVFTNGVKERLRGTKKEKAAPEQYAERINRLFKSEDSFSLAYLNEVSGGRVEDYFAGLGVYDDNKKQSINLFAQIDMACIAAADILAGKYVGELNQSETAVNLIKDLLDALKAVQRFIKPLLGSGDEADKDNEFDTKLRSAWNLLSVVTPLYNRVRNRLTRKPYSTEKIKLNFENPVLLDGWPNPEANSCLIFKDKESYFLGVLSSGNRTILRHIVNKPLDANDVIYKMTYLQGGDMGKNVQNLMIKDGKACKVNGRKETKGAFVGQNIRLEEDKNKYLPAKINRIRIQGSYSLSNPQFSKEYLNAFIDFYKPLVKEYYSDYKFTFKESSEYPSFKDFTDHINQQSYQLHFVEFSKKELIRLVDDGKLYLFRIWNKDFSEHSKGTPNLHTIYWKMLFDERNLADVVYKLNGQAEVFYRKKSLDIAKTTVHKANRPIANKNVHSEKRESTFDYDIVKNRRYTVDKFQFHVPITINFKASGNDRIEAEVLEAVRNGGIEHVIGIDRGERHLLYLSLIDLKGNIVRQFTLNDIVNEYKERTYATNYKDLLVAREGDREEARRNWHKIENIKDLKEGYLSQVVHIITTMMVEYKALVVLEDLNTGFMRGRQKIEHQVYQKFEKMLIDKLNCYVDKQKRPYETGGVLHPLQLTSKFESFRKLGKQSGWLFYIPAWKTSKIDPVTGFVNMFDIHYDNVEKARSFFLKFDAIRYNKEKDLFEFSFDYDNFTDKTKGTQTKWTLSTYGIRINTFRNSEKLNQWDSKEVMLTDEFKKVFADADIDINANLKEEICSLTEKKYLEPLMQLMKLLLQLRNSKTGTDIDYMLSPVADADGNFFDSRKGIETLPKDADANGAYNIARKGLCLIRRIQSTPEDKKPDLFISNKEWLQFAQQKPYLDD